MAICKELKEPCITVEIILCENVPFKPFYTLGNIIANRQTFHNLKLIQLYSFYIIKSLTFKVGKYI